MPAYFADDFNRADEAFSHPDITQSGTFNIVGNELHQTINYNGHVGLLYEPVTITDDQFVEVTMWDAGDTYGHSLRVRGDSGSHTYGREIAGNGYMWNGLGLTDWEFARNGTTIWAFPDYTDADIDAGGTTFRLEASGADVTWYRDGVEVTSYTDGTPLTGGYPGFSVAPGELTNVFDNFSAGDYLGKSFISDTMRSYTDGQTLDAQTGWTVENASGIGILTSDLHDQHAYYLANNGQVIDASTIGRGVAIWDADKLDSDDQTAEVGIWFDTFTANDNPNATGSLYLRYDGVSSGRDESGYRFRVLSEGGSTGPYFFVYIERVDSGSSTIIASDVTGTINESDEERVGVVRLTFKAVGSTLTGYINGREVLSTTDTNHTGATHRYVGWGLNRVISDSYSQPFGTNFAAWTPNFTNQAYTEYLGGTINTGDNGSSATATATNSLDAAAGEELFAVIHIRDYLSDEAPGVTSLTDDGTGGWTLETSHVDGGNQVGYYVYSKTAAGDETSLSLVAEGLSFIVMETYRFPSGWAYETAAWNSASAAAVTGTLSSDPKLGLAISGTSTLGGHGVAFVDGDFDRPIQVAMAAHSINLAEVEPVHGSALHDLGTATTAFTVAADVTTAASTVGAIVLAKAPPVYFRDDFNRADGAIGADWIDDKGDAAYLPNAGMPISGNQLGSDRTDGTMGVIYATPTATTAQFVEVDCLGGDGIRHWGLHLGHDGTTPVTPRGTGTGYQLHKNEWYPTWTIMEGNGQRFESASFGTGAAGTVRFEHDGSGTFTGWEEGVEIGQYVDGTPTQFDGNYIALYKQGGYFENFSAGDIGVTEIPWSVAATFSAYTGTLTVSGTGILSFMTDTGLVPV